MAIKFCGNAKPQVKIEDGKLATDIIQCWKNDPAVRAEFPSLNAYASWRQAEAENKQRVA